MKFIYAGKYNGDENTLPQRKHPKGSVPFKEAENSKKFGLLINIAAFILLILFLALAVWRVGLESIVGVGGLIGVFLSILCMVPHEFLHAIWFKGNVYMYQNLSEGMLFVVGDGDFTKARFIWMSLFPNIVFGVIPYILFMIFPHLTVLATMGALSLGAGAGDYCNVYNALTQMPKGSLTYTSGFHSFWYIPKKD